MMRRYPCGELVMPHATAVTSIDVITKGKGSGTKPVNMLQNLDINHYVSDILWPLTRRLPVVVLGIRNEINYRTNVEFKNTPSISVPTPKFGRSALQGQLYIPASETFTIKFSLIAIAP